MKKDAEPTEELAAHEGHESSATDDSGEDPTTRIAELEERCTELETRWLRAQADFQNVRRRAQQELDASLLQRLQPLLDELLLVADFLDMALSTPVTTPEGKALAQGVGITRSKLTQALELAEVRLIPTEGAFDPSLHEAAETRTSTDRSPGSIVAVLRPGYTWQGRILRPARVAVAAEPGAAPRGEA